MVKRKNKLKSYKRMNKKGEITDIIIFLIVIFFLAVSLITAVYVNTKLREVVATTVLNSTSTGQIVIQAYDTMNFTTVPNIYLMMVAFLIIGQIVTSFLVKYHPVFIVLFIVFAGFGIFLGFILANVYEQFVNVDQIQTVAEQMPKVNWIWSHISIIMSAVSALTLIILFARLPGNGGQI